MRAIVFGGTGPSGPFLVNGLLDRGYDVTILHGGFHEVEFDRDVEHVHTDPHFLETLEPALEGRSFDVTVASYGRIRLIADVMKGRTAQFIAFGGANYAPPDDPRWGPLAPVPWPETSPMTDDPERSLKFQYKSWLTERYVFEVASSGAFDATLLRFPRMYGMRAPGERLWSVVRRILDGRRRIIVANDGSRIDSAMYAENVAQAALLAVDNPEKAAGQLFNARDDSLFTEARRIAWAAQVMGVDIELVSVPQEFASAVSSVSSVEHFVLDNSKIKGELGYVDAVPAQEAIKRTVEWLLSDRPERGGELEKQLSDPFDYRAEDDVIAVYSDAAQRARTLDLPSMRMNHVYRHPKKPGEAWAAPAGPEAPAG